MATAGGLTVEQVSGLETISINQIGLVNNSEGRSARPAVDLRFREEGAVVSIDEQVRAYPDLDDLNDIDDVGRRDIVRLHQLGYAQELRRRMSGFSNFAVSFSIISVLTALTIYGYGLGTGGPADLVWGYQLVP